MKPIDLTRFEGPTPIECITCMPAHCDTCPDHVEAIRRLKAAPALVAEVRRLRGDLESLARSYANRASELNDVTAMNERLRGALEWIIEDEEATGGCDAHSTIARAALEGVSGDE